MPGLPDLLAPCSWLVLQLLSALFLPADDETGVSGYPSTTHACVFLTSFREADFWREGARRIGCDLSSAERHGRLRWIESSALLAKTGPRQANSMPGSGSVQLQAVQDALAEALKDLKDQHPDAQVSLISDGLDFMLAAGGCGAGGLLETVYELRSKVASMVVTASADAPLIHKRETPLEVEHALLVTSLAHQASYTMSLRQLSTGAARDVSGVLRITKGAVEIAPKELLYLVGKDGSAKIFERGAQR